MTGINHHQPLIPNSAVCFNFVVAVIPLQNETEKKEE